MDALESGYPVMNLVDLGRHLLGVGQLRYGYHYGRRMACYANCSGHGQCLNGSCYCMIQYEGSHCDDANFSFHVAFSSIFSLMALTSLIQLGMCIHSEYLRQKSPSIWKAFRVTTQKMLYSLMKGFLNIANYSSNLCCYLCPFGISHDCVRPLCND